MQSSGDPIAPISAEALIAQEFRPLVWAVPHFMPEGLNLFAGVPKSGKTTFCLDIAVGVAGGTHVLNVFDVGEAGDVLYLALEEPLRRLQEYITPLLDKQAVPGRLDLISVEHDFPPLSAGGLEHIEQWIAARPAPRLIVVDTLARLWPRANAGGGSPGRNAIAALLKLVRAHNIVLLVVFNTRATSTEGAIQSFGHSFGLDGMVDNVLLLKSTRGRQDTRVVIAGRDVGHDELMIVWDPDDEQRWIGMGYADEVALSAGREVIVDTIANEGRSLSPKELFDILQADGDELLYNPATSYNALRQRMYQMRRAGLLQSWGGRYWLPPEDTSEAEGAPNTLT